MEIIKRITSNKSIKIIPALLAYAIAMAMLEAAAVVYLRELYYPSGVFYTIWDLFYYFFPLSHLAMATSACDPRCLFLDSLAVGRTGMGSINFIRYRYNSFSVAYV